MTGFLIRARIAATVGAVFLLTVSGTAALALAAPGAESAPDVLVSSDGEHFASSLPVGLFGSYGLLIPDGSMQSSLWIQNPSDRPANVRVSLREPGGASADRTVSDLREYLILTVEDAAAQTVTTVPQLAKAGCAVLAPEQPLAAGATLQVAFTIEMMNVTGLTAQNARAELGVLVALRDVEAGPFAASACNDDGVLIPAIAGPSESQPSDALPRTGVDLPVPAIIGGGLLLGVGVLLVTRRRRDRREP
ncbi:MULTISPECIES: LPXTG cell wall anchor domain-containing protein [unclassified Cryobacterium]|uniref:LPXTG cell wall anchor domain-containing protein n=1 Tax=unclassified Cryobacterium TaxID=2649013 RepID=UPI000CE39707|nr:MULTISPECIES: LPXTG cell wall anchor domain-containing protein [unclassified Cryobacterium]